MKTCWQSKENNSDNLHPTLSTVSRTQPATEAAHISEGEGYFTIPS